ncbi:hypothetical protein PHYBLDRAFT_145633 [Phycomyces blakesleeanus NRRL 1555(-)]|uniref:Uncharacterized protein n=1 Tax=Phycomyces blakesleeanus (strain ATCC 8743b / DSM 1359 / FGSC 10004 / NBRC 33097 / NRRL 1555) TaxID=763407 RepID=A0A163DSX2_PHYB8|nr:hypothetical protein PHYBLDRAFT_145633 [Phycomyces blakesleeanus NRRL 1555(-)]OAD73230.1 hypothetical protein PHYBLDRAFT_145633 [Phycomyces blakesleeanus NRRL 1555(-)]|eukprot:XP_018291270.1 hypothetical protein PHYBLDRAFT_145633 [Phycomyces blakesleeanus NRRL 1555(-)]
MSSRNKKNKMPHLSAPACKPHEYNLNSNPSHYQAPENYFEQLTQRKSRVELEQSYLVCSENQGPREKRIYKIMQKVLKDCNLQVCEILDPESSLLLL